MTSSYCRVSTDSEEQASSYEIQIEHYTNYIKKNKEWELAGIFADDGITGTNTKKREEFNRMIEECMSGKIDMIITKSISRFARNTLDCKRKIWQRVDSKEPADSESGACCLRIKSHLVLHSCAAFQGSRDCTIGGSLRFALFAVFISHVR